MKGVGLFSSLEKHWLILIALGVSLAIFLSELWILDFFQRGHVNWVSLDSLAFANDSSFAHGGVGYGHKEMDGLMVNRYEYFNRYPLFFAALSCLVESLQCLAGFCRQRGIKKV